MSLRRKEREKRESIQREEIHGELVEEREKDFLALSSHSPMFRAVLGKKEKPQEETRPSPFQTGWDGEKAPTEERLEEGILFRLEQRMEELATPVEDEGMPLLPKEEQWIRFPRKVQIKAESTVKIREERSESIPL